jgi:hypothetical protein
MGGLDIVGISVVAAGAMLALAGVLLTPARGVVVRAVAIGRRRNAGAPAPVETQREAAEPAAVPAAAAGTDYREHEALFARTLLTAQKTAEDLVRNAQAEAEQILAKAKRDADLIVRTTDQQAAAWLAQLRAEADTLVADAHQAFLLAQRSVEQDVEAFNASRPAFRVPDLGADLHAAGARPSRIA